MEKGKEDTATTYLDTSLPVLRDEAYAVQHHVDYTITNAYEYDSCLLVVCEGLKGKVRSKATSGDTILKVLGASMPGRIA